MNTIHPSAQALQAIADIAQEHGKNELLAQFIQIYFATLSQNQLTTSSQNHLAYLACHHFELLKKYENAPKIEVFNPTQATHGFESPKTLIQLVAQDRPFLTDTLLMSLESAGVVVHDLLTAIVHVEKDQQMTAINKANQSYAQSEHIALVHIEIDRQHDEELMNIQNALLDKIATLDVVVGDWRAMQDKLVLIKEELKHKPLPQIHQSKQEVLEFLDWIGDNNFIFMGFREYRFEADDLYAMGKTGLGLLEGQDKDTLSDSFSRLPAHLRQLLKNPRVILLSKSKQISPIHRPVYMDFLGIQKLDDTGRVVGEYRFLGLLTSRAYHTQVADIALLREKCDKVLEQTQFVKGGHAYTKAVHILNTLPRDDLFQASIEELTPIVVDIVRLQDKNALKLFARFDHYHRFVSCLVYIPKHKFDTQLRLKIQEVLMKVFGGISSSFSTEFNELHHARVHFHIRTQPDQVHEVDINALEQTLTKLMHNWDDDYAQAILEQLGLRAKTLLPGYLPAIPAAYKERFDTKTAVDDTKLLLTVQKNQHYICKLMDGGDDTLILKVYGINTPKTLSDVLPVLEDFGVSVIGADTYVFNHNTHIPSVWLQVYALKTKANAAIDLSVVGVQFEQTMSDIWQGRIESDRLNELILITNCNCDDVVVLRALAKYMIQAKAPFSSDYIYSTLVGNPRISERLLDLFHAKFNPQAQKDTAVIIQEIEALLANITSLDEDRIVRWLLDLLQAMVRTNFYQTQDGKPKDRLSFKFKAADIPYLPKPKPMFEIYVYSPRTEGVHLRGGKVARGGLRWSDRMEDYRTEVLGLVKAQMVKNAVIVPVGSKGGFVCKDKSMQTDREAWQKEGIACYQTFVRGLLDLTDNLVDGKIVPPADTVRHDEDDPYLVVAADKGTATFSDIANGLSAEYNFWLQDAFASGGSAGYDHKGMGITARGAWESVKRHFRLMNKDIQNEEFSVIGIGDMSGDVFGNGMLLSQKILLKAAFNHLHIFIDPNPTADKSFAERERLFNNRLGWAEYDKSLISQGGGVFHRTDKSIKISDEMKQAFDIDADELTPNELLKALLKAPVDLLWNGGIGTYVKASDEEHSDVGDRANDAIRVNGNEVGAKVIGEGGNLGCTQKGRIEYALNGGRIYTDAIDNSGGVNCSDHEVNIKILLSDVVKNTNMSLQERNELLASMTDEVARLVLRQNYLQPQAIELSSFEAKTRLNEHARFIEFLENAGRLDRTIEYLPSKELIATRQKAGVGLTNPEFAVLLAYGKMWVYDQMLNSDLPDDEYFLAELKKYFPKALSEHYFGQMTQHRLHREIICTYLTNGLVNRLGIENVFYLFDEMDKSVADITRAYAIARDVFDIQSLWDTLGQLDGIAPAQTQLAIEIDIRNLMKSVMAWLLAHENIRQVEWVANKYKTATAQLLDNKMIFDAHFAHIISEQSHELVVQGVPQQHVAMFARLPVLANALDVVRLADAEGFDQTQVATAYFGVAKQLSVDELSKHIKALPAKSDWDRRAANALLLSLNRLVLGLSQQVLKQGFESWKRGHDQQLKDISHKKAQVLQEPSLASLSVLLGDIATLSG